MKQSHFSSILITGASSGIGAALALELAAPNVQLHLIARNKKRLDDIQVQCIHKGAAVYTYILDITNKEQCAHIFSMWNQQNPFDLVIANAGIAGGSIKTESLTARLRELNHVNVTGILNCLEPILDTMIKRKKGHIALMSSMASLLPMPSSPAYCASKAAISTWGNAIQPILKKDNIGVSVIHPGFIRSRMTDGNQYKMPFFMEADKAARIIIHKLNKNKRYIAFPLPAYWLISFLSILPRPIQFFILSWLPH